MVPVGSEPNESVGAEHAKAGPVVPTPDVSTGTVERPSPVPTKRYDHAPPALVG